MSETSRSNQDSDDDLMPDEHPFAQYVRIIGRGKRARRDFTREEAAQSMAMILAGNATAEQVGAWLMLLRVKEETAEELAGFVDACRDWLALHHAAMPEADIDWPSYAGKKKHHPWYVLAALLLARNGVRIFMHSGPEHTPGRLYSDEVLQALGVPVATSMHEAQQQLQQDNFTCVPMDVLCPPLADLLRLRFQLGLRSPINTLSRCINPVRAPLNLQSVFHPSYSSLQQGAAQLLGDHGLLLFKGDGGEVEIRPDAETKLYGLRDGEPFEDRWPATLPRQLTEEKPDAEALKKLWQDDDNEYGRAAVLETAAVVLYALGKATSKESAQTLATKWWQARTPL